MAVCNSKLLVYQRLYGIVSFFGNITATSLLAAWAVLLPKGFGATQCADGPQAICVSDGLRRVALNAEFAVHSCIHTFMSTYIHTYIHACMHTYIHTDIHTYIFNHIYIYMWYICIINTVVKFLPHTKGIIATSLHLVLQATWRRLHRRDAGCFHRF